MKKIFIPIIIFCIISCMIIPAFADDITQNLAFVKIYRYVQSSDSYTWLNTEFNIDEFGDITTEYDPNAFQREMLDFIFPAKTVNDVTFSYTIKVTAAGNPTVTSNAGSMRLRFDGTNVSTKTVRGTYKIQSGVCIYQVNTIRFEFDTPITIDEIDITSYINGVAAQISFEDVSLVINDETYTIKKETEEFIDDVSSQIEEFNSIADQFESEFNNYADDITIPSGKVTEFENILDEFDINTNVSLIFNILDAPMFAVFSIIPVLMVIAYLLFGRGQ